MRLWVQPLALLVGLRIQHCSELWCRLQTQLGSSVAVAVAQAGSNSSNWTPSLGTSMHRGCSPRRDKKKKKKKIFFTEFPLWHNGLRIQCCLCGSAGSSPSPAQWVTDLMLL